MDMHESIAVAIIDSGIARDISIFQNKIIGGFSIFENDNKILFDDKYDDSNGHGTACAYTISKQCKYAKFFIIKILNTNGVSSSKKLLEALKALKNINVKIINLSLSTLNNEYRKELFDICEELKQQGKIIVNSLRNNSRYSFPTMFSSVIGVKGVSFLTEKEYWFDSKKQVQCLVDNTPIIYDKNCREHDIFYGNSKSTALFTGILCGLLLNNKVNTFDEAVKLIKENAIRSKWNNIKKLNVLINREVHESYKEFTKEQGSKIINILKEQLKCEQMEDNMFYKYNLIDPIIGLNASNIISVIKSIENQCNIKLDYEKISGRDFISIYDLLYMIHNNQE
ncbi:S8 family serine peptidase [Clostridium hydrogenum]|uniref:S8 family serine peptidase n=1 Tax=Clostridium hydrogenum TaxID=2855764 RepID=UPI001F3E9FD6|nr:S8 family serine peptidase [Clostridium hydrogenum]